MSKNSREILFYLIVAVLLGLSACAVLGVIVSTLPA
jgi:hypothetical protein